MKEKRYLCIDLKSFYASVECVERGLDPMQAKLVVADPGRSDKTICLAVSPALKKMGVRNRCRVFEIPRTVEYLMAPPRMQKYIDYAAEIYGVYLKYISPEDIHVYSIDEAFFDVTPYLGIYGKTAKEMAVMLMDEISRQIGVRAAAGVGTNLYLAKIAMDIVAKHAEDYIGVLNEKMYRTFLWDHRPLTDFWRIGRQTEAKLARMGIFTMRDIAHAPEDMLYRKFGIDAELLIDHAWGRESTTIADIKRYVPKSKSLSHGQVLMRDYTVDEGRIILREMAEQLCLDMTAKELKASSVTFYAGYSTVSGGGSCGGTASFPGATNAHNSIVPAVLAVYDREADRMKKIRRFYVYCNDVVPASQAQQLSLFDINTEQEEKDRQIQQAVVDIKSRFGKNALFKGVDLLEAATALERNMQIGGHKAGV